MLIWKGGFLSVYPISGKNPDLWDKKFPRYPEDKKFPIPEIKIPKLRQISGPNPGEK